MPDTLPDPVWTESAELCIGCGYSLRGLSAPGRCPECGVAFAARQLVLSGVANRSKPASAGRRMAWVAVIVGAVLLSIIWPAFIMLPAAVAIISIVGVGGGLIALLVTGPRERRGTERFIVAPGGIARIPLVVAKGQNRLDTIFTAWGGANAVEFRATSTVWRRLRVLVKGADGRVERVVFDAGVRCPAAEAARVEGVIGELLRSASGTPPTAPGATIPLDI